MKNSIKITGICSLAFVLSNCKTSPEAKKRMEMEQLRTYTTELMELYNEAKPFFDRVYKIVDSLHMPVETTLELDQLPDPSINFDMKTGNVLWYQVDAENYIPMENAPDFKMMDVMLTTKTSKGMLFIEEKYEKLKKDSLLLLKDAIDNPDSTGLRWFAAGLSLKKTPYAIFFRELHREDTDIEEKDWLTYTFDGGGIIVAVWVADLRNYKILGSYITRTTAKQAWSIEQFGDKTPEDKKMRKMKRTIYMTASQELQKTIVTDIKNTLQDF